MGHLESDPTPARLNARSAGGLLDGHRRRLLLGLSLTFTLAWATGCAGSHMRLFEGQRPDTLGARDGQLQAIDAGRRNAVSSTAAPPHQIAPLVTGSDPGADFARLASLITANPLARIVEQRNDYLYAEYRSRWLGFVDDVEFLLVPGQRVIHVRSASRLGYSDLGVNRARIESLRTALAGAAQ